MAMTPFEEMQAALERTKYLNGDTSTRDLIRTWALVSIAESLKEIADSLPWEVKRVGDIVVGRSKADD